MQYNQPAEGTGACSALSLLAKKCRDGTTDIEVIPAGDVLSSAIPGTDSKKR